MVFRTSVQNILPIILLIVLGYILRKKRYFSDSFSEDIPKFLINIGLPCSVFVSLLRFITKGELIHLSKGLIYTGLGFVLMYAVTLLLVKVLKLPKGRRMVFFNAMVNGNTIFIGFPLNIAFFGERILPYFLVYYLTSTLSTWGIGATLITADSPDLSVASERKPDLKKLIPIPLLAVIVALIILMLEVELPPFLLSTLGYVGATVTPFSLIYIGIALCDAGLKSIKFERDAIIVLFGRFVLAPALMMLSMVLLEGRMTPLPTEAIHSYVLQSSAPVFASLGILAAASKSDEGFATNVITLSTLLFIFVVPIVMSLLNYFA